MQTDGVANFGPHSCRRRGGSTHYIRAAGAYVCNLRGSPIAVLTRLLLQLVLSISDGYRRVLVESSVRRHVWSANRLQTVACTVQGGVRVSGLLAITTRGLLRGGLLGLLRLLWVNLVNGICVVSCCCNCRSSSRLIIHVFTISDAPIRKYRIVRLEGDNVVREEGLEEELVDLLRLVKVLIVDVARPRRVNSDEVILALVLKEGVPDDIPVATI